MKKLPITCLLVIIWVFAYATNTPDSLTIINIKSSINHVEYQLYIRKPDNAEGQNKPAILLLDADYYHRTFMSLYDSVASRKRDHYIIGIGYVPNSLVGDLFMQDFTPTPVKGYPNSGGAATFKQVLEKEILPFILTNYLIDRSKLAIVGHHYSALFLSWLITQQTSAFSHYIICSPVLAFNEEFIPEKSYDGTNQVGLYLSSGSVKIKYVDNLKLNDARFKNLADAIRNKLDLQTKLKVTHFHPSLRYEELYAGFAEGISFILSNHGCSGSFTTTEKPAVALRTTVLVDKIYYPSKEFSYEITTWIPPGAVGKLPLIVILDSDFNFAELLYSYRAALAEGKVPKCIIVGVGYGSTIIGKGNFRGRDFLPKKIRNVESGNGENFAKLINIELLTYVSRFPVDMSNATIEGHSYAGLFLTWLLGKEVPYRNFIISSPALWQDPSILRDIENSTSRFNYNIFVASGLVNDNDKDAKKLSHVLNDRTNALDSIVLYPNDGHLTTTSKAFVDGLIFFNKK